MIGIYSHPFYLCLLLYVPDSKKLQKFYNKFVGLNNKFTILCYSDNNQI